MARPAGISDYFEDLADSSSSARVKIKKSVLENLPGRWAGEVLKNYDMVGFTPNVMFIKENQGNKSVLHVDHWKSPTLLFAHKKLPATLMMGSGKANHLKQSLSKARRSKPTEILDYFYDLAKSSPEFRRKIKNLAMKHLSSYSHKGEGHPDKSAGRLLVKDIKQNYEFVGFTPNVMYIKEYSGKGSDPLYVHPWGMPTLLFAHKKGFAFMIVNPGIRFNKNFLEEHGLKKTNTENVNLCGLSG